tara:strand:- start:152 stop:625 length:474 start_codon:yes stop_codon:yes gene_type:complete
MHPANVVNVSGGTKTQRELAYKLVEHCIDEMLPRHRTLWIEVDLKKIPEGDKVVGYCQDDGDNQFTIEIDKTQNAYDFMLTVAHEMVHVKQSVRRQLTERNLRHFWYGKEHSDRRNEPWEIEAWKLQKPLTHSYIKQGKRTIRYIKSLTMVTKECII